MSIQFDTTTKALEASLDLRMQRQELLASNLANIDTPNYRPSDLRFEGFLTEAADAGAPTGADAGEVLTSDAPATSLDGNTVDLDEQVSKMADNTVRYDATLELVRRKLAILRYAAGMGSNG